MFTPPLTDALQHRGGCFPRPDDWHIANVSPVYKKGQKSLAENYRPILPSKIMKHEEENNILYLLQHGFRKGHSCETQLIEFVDYISKNLQDGQQTDILILDFAKAFDKVNHSLLIHKLQHYGIIGKSVRWIQNWLANRKQSVVIDGSTSDAVSVDSGVPQGSVLGPGLFLYNINDL
jgi:retron-type reverse transcriptase